jgi:hypothetical protein
MTRTICLVCCAPLLSFHSLASAGQKPIAESTTVALTATIESIDKANRTVTLKKADGGTLEIKAPEQMQGFNTLKVGDEVTATYYEAVLVNLRKPGDPAPPSQPTTAIERKERKPGSETRRQQTFRVTVESIDPKAQSLTVKGPQGRIVVLKVEEPKSLQNVKAGDTVDVTYFESLLVNVARPSK